MKEIDDVQIQDFICILICINWQILTGSLEGWVTEKEDTVCKYLRI